MNDDQAPVSVETVDEIRAGYDRICGLNDADPDAKLLAMCGIRYSLDVPNLLAYIDQQGETLNLLQQRYADEQIDALGDESNEGHY